ncbi:hypothetical protein M0657_012279 [Pyricularia oryzae]|uniref:Uncharacterized protein n=1 Tax=Pyricularia oryzae (strain P131) TaxID=1143193 RepID=L7J0V3_PYRO1|nr:hypothetical protein M0657_012279 [Pyricularia oryzae]KAI7909101.1 hypothetical protein M9X92_011826 [Pyricularia oryzae]
MLVEESGGGVRPEEIGQLARETTSTSKALEDLARHIRTEPFIFELDYNNQPKLIKGRYECSGYLSCRMRAHTTRPSL